jgi:hypothetical protein
MSRISDVCPEVPRVEKPNPNWPVEYVLEVPLLTEDYRSVHWYQIIGFIDRHSQEPGLYVEDLGENLLNPRLPFRQPIAGEHSFAEARYMAEEARGRGISVFTAAVLKKAKDESTLFADALDQAELDNQVAHNISVFGPGKVAGTQRNAFPTLTDDKSKFGRR